MRPARALLSELNLYGLAHLDAVILAALADEQPLLLIGAHGTAKSALLNRLAAALGLAHRHYNASLISFDDLLGFPVPNESRTAVTYLRTPGDLWDAESVFVDEISRCRPETQNKLFSIVHERRIQGLALERLRYRWAAMNPAAPEDPLADDAPGAETYAGSFALDAALADRFAYVVEVPAICDLPREERGKLISSGDAAIAPAAAARVRALVGAARSARGQLGGEAEAWAARYVEALLVPLTEASLPISGRRAALLARSVLSLAGAAQALGAAGTLEDCAATALRWGLPHRARGIRIEQAKLASIHRAAAAAAGEADSPWHVIRAERDPLARFVLALSLHPACVSTLELSNLLTDALGSLTVPKRWVLARNLFPIATARGCLNVPAFELISAPMQKLAGFCANAHNVFHMGRERMPEWNALLARAGRLNGMGEREAQMGNLMLALFAVENQKFDPEKLEAFDERCRSLFASAPAEHA